MTEVLVNQKVAEQFYYLSFKWDKRVTEPKPGQFFTMSASASTDPLLRRPFAFSAFNSEKCEAAFLYQVRGKATTLFSKLIKGDSISILGPLGNSFDLSKSGRNPIVVGGGIGLGPMLFLANRLKNNGKNPTFVSGFRTKSFIPETSDSRIWSDMDVKLSTDDGSFGYKGNVVELLNSIDSDDSTLYCCGPHPMMKALVDWSGESTRDVIVSVEEVMACGIGACYGCAIESSVPGKTYRVCKDGPVFNAEDLKWN